MIEQGARSYINISNYDLDTAKDLLQAGRYIYVAFFCRQAIEKLLKGLYTDFKNEKPDFGHDLLKVFHKLEIKEADVADKEKFMTELNRFYLKPTIILFGSTSTGYDTEESDIDLVIITEKKQDFPKKKALGKELQLFVVNDLKELRNEHLIKNVLNGIVLQGEINFAP